MNALDQRLYAWLVEPDDRRFERAFNDYFAVAFPAVVRYLASLSRWEPERVEDLAQEALLRFFDRAGRARREASRNVVSALGRLHADGGGSFHDRQVKAWIDDVAKFTSAAMGFRVPQDELAAKSAIQAFVQRIDMLLRQGEQLLRGMPDAGHQPAGAQAFRDDVHLVTGCLPLLRVPTNSYLFQIARSIFLDECRKCGRQKRGGAAAYQPPDGDVIAGPLSAHPLETPEAADGFEDSAEESAPPAARAPAPSTQCEPVVDPAREYESEEFFRKFHAYLRAPLDRAADAYQRASVNGRAAAERQKLESLTAKFTRTIAVLSAIGEGHTQEQVAELLGLSRNQVKYIVELVQDAYAQFVRTADPSAPSSSNVREPSHAR